MRLVNSAETWQKVYQAFQQVNFSAWDFNTIKQSLVDYLKLYYPEDFNDFIESDELIAILELFAYIGELMAYRYDLDAHENLLPVANIKASVLRLAKIISYNASRNLPARGLVKITSISTTEKIFDSKGNALANKIIFWDDPNNSNWKDQFILVMNRILEQNFGTVAPSDRIQVQDVVFELYGMNNEPLATETVPYTISVSGNQYPMELVSSELNEFGPIEKRPQKNQVMNVMYLNDGLGDSSDNTGFFFYTKQGTLQRTATTFDGVTPNQTFTVAIPNSNEIDVWLNNIDPDTGKIIIGTNTLLTYKEGEWEKVDLSNAQNILFNTNKNRNKYEIETLDSDEFRLIFGDGQFANIPSGTFEVWSRTSANEDLVIPTSSIQNLASTFLYFDNQTNQQTFSFTFSLLDTIQNAAISEDIEHIRRVAPSVYYTQDRMSNGRDYNEFPLQDNSILKLRTINRTFAGDSKYIAWHDASEYYDNVKMYGNDLVIYFNTHNNYKLVNNSDLPSMDGGANTARIAALIENYIQPLLYTDDIYLRMLLEGMPVANVRRTFTATEITAISNALSTSMNSSPALFYLNYNSSTDVWSVLITNQFQSDYWIIVTAYANGNFNLSYRGKQMVAHSEEMSFWVTNNIKVLNFDTLNNVYDTIVLLKANIGYTPYGTNTCNPVTPLVPSILTSNYNFYVVKQLTIDTGSTAGNLSEHDLVILPYDTNNDGSPDCVGLSYLINQDINFGNIDYVYFERTVTDTFGYSRWYYREATQENIAAYDADVVSGEGLWKREIGKANLNFLWLHSTPRYHLVDPSPSNIMDMYILTRGYYANLKLWLSNKLNERPVAPSSFDLRNSYNYLLDNKTQSDGVILHSGLIKIIIGEHANDELKASLKVIKSSNSTLTNNQIKAVIVDAVIDFFDVNYWEFGETFYFTELGNFIQSKLPIDINSVVLVPLNQNNVFGDMYQVYANVDEIIQPSITVNDIDIVESLDPRTLRNNL